MKTEWQPTFELVSSGFRGQTYGDGNSAKVMTHRYPSNVQSKMSWRVDGVVTPENMESFSLMNRSNV